MNQPKYSEIIEQLQNCVNAYERSNMDDNKVTLYLANGEVINVRFPKSGVAHLLGVDIEYLKQSNMFPSSIKGTYELLKYFLENSYTFSKLIYIEKKLSADNIFSKDIEKKIDSFWDNLHIRIDDVVAIVKYDRERAYQSEQPLDVSDYYIIRKK